MAKHQILHFLEAVSENNNKAWFEAHRADYAAAREAFEAKVQTLIPHLADLDERLGRLTLRDCTYRFHRDTRFSADKSPYKNHFGAYFNAYGKKAEQGGYYIHIEPNGCLVAGGAYCLSPKTLRAVRQSIVDDIDEFHDIVASTPFAQWYKEMGMTQLKTMPKGFPKNFAHPEYLRPRDYSVFTPVSDDFFFAPDWVEQTLERFRALKPFLDFINFTIDEAE